MSAETEVRCYVNSPVECDDYRYTCESCGRSMCFSHSHQASCTGSDETIRVCQECVAR